MDVLHEIIKLTSLCFYSIKVNCGSRIAIFALNESQKCAVNVEKVVSSFKVLSYACQTNT